MSRAATDRARIGVTRWADMSPDKVQPYWQRVQGAGGEVVDLAGPDVPSGLDGVVLTGGIDIDPARYGADPHDTVKRVDPARDSFELDVLGAAFRQNLPVLAICRGHQLLNVALGGSLVQHIENGNHVAHLKTEGQPSRWHSARLMSASLLADILGVEGLEVNSRHHQAVTLDTLAPSLAPAGFSHDGLVEAAESQDHGWVVGVQWHPERPEPDNPAFAPASRRLFEAFVRAASAISSRA